MYISNIHIQNYRGLNNLSVDFKDGINILIGPNNSGKSNLLRALALIFDGKAHRQLNTNDFYNGITLECLKQQPPKISITVILTQSDGEDLMGDELVTVSNWLIKLEEPYSAQLQYEFFLPEEYEPEYIAAIRDSTSLTEAWERIDNLFIRKYVYKIWAGNPENQVQVDGEGLSKFDFQFLDAIRDVERDMFSGKNTLLKNVLDFFLDYDIKSNKKISQEDQAKQIVARKKEFKVKSDDLILMLKGRLENGKNEILSYADHIGASFDHSKPTFEGTLSENEVYSILQLLIQQETGMKLPIANNGLGYNNLIFMSLLLAKMQVDSDGDYLGSNAKVFPVLAIEEPEAHLHPTMQFQFVKFLKDNLKDKKVRQVFITSHSTHITSSADLEDLICLYKAQDVIHVSYPGKAFVKKLPSGEETECTESKKYVQRFLDATKSNMLFAEKIILVEGMAEQLLIPIFADYLGKNLEEHHVSVINVGGRCFDHFLYLFDSTNTNAINRKVVCITDIDPMRQKNREEDGDKGSQKKCYPFEYDIEPDEYTYIHNTSLNDRYGENNHPNIRAFTQSCTFGKTLEYQIAFENPTCKLLMTPSLENGAELQKMMDAFTAQKPLEDILGVLRKSDENKRISEALRKELPEVWTEEKKKKALIASRYLNSVGKGENALELASALQDRYTKDPITANQEFCVPEYIKSAIEWVCDDT